MQPLQGASKDGRSSMDLLDKGTYVCPGCGLIKPADAFGSKGQGQRRARCRACCSEERKARVVRRRSAGLCIRCGQLSTKDREGSLCSVCARKKQPAHDRAKKAI